MSPTTTPSGRNRWWTLGLLAVLVQLVAIYRPNPPPMPSAFPDLDKVGHFLIFAAPVFCLLLATRTPNGRLGRRARWLVPIVFLAHAVLSEILQYHFYSHRDGDPFDALADSIGIVFGLLAALAWGALVGRRTVPT